MKLVGWTLAAGMVFATAGESQAQLRIGGPVTGVGVSIGGGGIAIGPGVGYPYGYYGYGFNPYNAVGVTGYNSYGLPGTGFYSSGYVAPGILGGYGAYSGTSYLTPYYGGYSSYGYTYPRYYRRGLFGRRYRW